MARSKNSTNLRPEVHFPPVQNGMDYLRSVVTHLTWRPYRARKPNPGPEQLKYAVLHLQAAAEVLLKARLLHEHWSLVFQDPGKANRKKFEEGDFASCGLRETVKRLSDIAGVDIGEAARRALEDLAASRNALQHYGLTDSAAAVEARAASVLDFLLAFVEGHLLPQLSEADAVDVSFELGIVTEGVTEIKQFVKARMDRLSRKELKRFKNQTVKCPSCKQWALVVDSDGPRCLVCMYKWESWEWEDLPGYYKRSVQGLRTEEIGDHIATCPRCNMRTLTSGVSVARAPERHFQFCFRCGLRA